MWYVQTLNDHGEWVNYPGLESCDPDKALAMLLDASEYHKFIHWGRIHPVSIPDDKRNP